MHALFLMTQIVVSSQDIDLLKFPGDAVTRTLLENLKGTRNVMISLHNDEKKHFAWIVRLPREQKDHKST